MLLTADLIATVGGLIFPPAFDFIKKKFLKGEADTPERTISSLATTKPEILPQYVTALSTFKETEIKFFNRDVIGSPSQWVSDLRATIRPIGVIGSLVILAGVALAAAMGQDITGTDGVRVSCELITGSWFGHRIALQN